MKPANRRRLILGVGFIVLILLLRYLGVGKYITLKSIQENRLWLQMLIDQHYWSFVAGFIGVYILGTALSLPVSIPLSLTGGFFFGTFPGALLAITGATIGSTISFLLIRDLFGKLFQERYKEQLKTFNREFKCYGYNYLLLLHVVMVIPLFIPNVLAGLAHVSLWTFIWTTAVGLIPGALTFSFTGQQLMTINSVHEVLSFKVFLIGLLLLLLTLTPLIIRWFRIACKKKVPTIEV